MPTVNINGSRLKFGAAGQGSTVVALHSSASTGAQWNSLTEHLANRHCVFTPDLPGYGGSDAWPGGRNASLASEADVIVGMIEAWEEPVHLVGHSYGGAIALQIALTNPEWVRSLTLIEPTAFHLLRDGNAADQQLHATMQALRGVVNAAAALGNPAAGMQHFIDFWNGEESWLRTHPRLRDYLVSQIGQLINNFAAASNEHWRLEECAELQCPTMALVGLDSPAPAQRTTEMLAEAIPGARLHMIAGAGHMLPLTDPHVVDPLISGHIRAAEATEDKRRAIWPLRQAA